ncbi:ABC transporter permease subunit, partial [Priestia megaterium]|uniref:ABC transporter permease subunit n=1 Tax=Priestia megaterium TaxID=1404 RepID=UPI0035BB001E
RFLATRYVARNLRRSRVGRTIIGTRDNERAAAGFSIEPTRAKMTAFAVSGAMAGLAGALYVTAVRGVPFSGFSPVISLQIFTM